jgi:hypothetical protein
VRGGRASARSDSPGPRARRGTGYARGESPLGYAEPKDDLLVEYDDDVLRERDHEFATDRSDEFAEWVP